MMTTSKLITSHDPKGLHFLGLCGAAYNSAGLDAGRAQRLNEQGGAFQIELQRLISEFTTILESPPTPVWISGYMQRPISQQVIQLQELFPGIGDADESCASTPLPKGAECYFAIPRWEKIAPTYREAVEKVLAMIKRTREGKFRNLREGMLGSLYLRQEEKTTQAFETLAAQQPGHTILVVPAQLGDKYKGQRVCQVQEDFADNEFGFDAFAAGIVLLTHPERLQAHDALFLDCAGGGYSLKADGQFMQAPEFSFDENGRIVFSSFEVEGDSNEYYGSATGFVQEE